VPESFEPDPGDPDEGVTAGKPGPVAMSLEAHFAPVCPGWNRIGGINPEQCR